MYPNQAGRTLDKENEATARGAAPHGTMAKQATSLIDSRTPSSKQQHQQSLAKTPSQQGKASALAPALNSPTVLRAKTNFQKPPPVLDNNATTGKKKSNLARTFSAALDSNNTNNNITAGTGSGVSTNSPFSLSVGSNSDNRRRSLTRRGSAKTRLVIHKDEPCPQEQETVPKTPPPRPSKNRNTSMESNLKQTHKNILRSNLKPASALVLSAPTESATTLLSIERAVESQDKVVVGPAENNTKRRALTNDDDLFDIEYCPPPVEEQPYDPGFELDDYALRTVPPEIAYTYASRAGIVDFEEGETGIPFVVAKITRPSVEAETATPMAKATITADGQYDVVWSDEEENTGRPVLGGGSRQFWIKDLEDESKMRPPFHDFVFDLEVSEDSLSEDEDDIFGAGKVKKATAMKKKAEVEDKADDGANDFHEAFGLGDLDDESKVRAPFSDFKFEI